MNTMNTMMFLSSQPHSRSCESLFVCMLKRFITFSAKEESFIAKDRNKIPLWIKGLNKTEKCKTDRNLSHTHKIFHFELIFQVTLLLIII